MVLVDTTIWIDFFNDKKNFHVDKLGRIIDDNEDICINGVIISEILQGIKSDQEFAKVKEILNDLIYLDIEKETYLHAAQIYRQCRKNGYTIRKAIDCIIAATCVDSGTLLLHNDRDFTYISRFFPLQCL